jgi:two-component system cell cycle sensor histidine kinase/response regulator CckA
VTFEQGLNSLVEGIQTTAELDNTPEVVSRFDREHRHLYINAAVELVTGVAPDRFLGRTSRELGLPEETCALWEREIGAVFESGEARRFEFEFDGADRVLWAEAVALPERNAAGVVESVISFTRDRTEAHRVEQEALANEARYHELFERALDMVLVLDAEGRVADLNPAVTRTLGYQREELIGQPFTLWIAPEERDAAAARLADKMDGTRPASFYRSVVLHKDGHRVPIEASSEVLIRGGVAAGVMTIARDISDQVAARAELEESERRFRSAFEDAAVGMILADTEGTLLRVNAAFAEMLGYHASELAGMRIEQLVHPEDFAAVSGDFERLRAGLDARCVFEERLLRSDGMIAIGHVSVSTVRSDDGSMLHFVEQIEDVTELRRVQVELEESQALHRILIESSHDILSVLDLDGTVRLVSRSVENALGYSPEELVGRSYRELMHPDDLQAANAALEAALRGEETPMLRSRMIAKDGRIRLFDGTIAPGFAKDRQATFVVANSRDVTDQMELEDQLRQAQKMEAIGRLAGGIAHDFNNQLLAIRAYAELALRQGQAHNDSSAEIGEVIAAADQAASLTAQLLAFSRRQVMNPEVIDLRVVAADMVKLLQRLIGENVELTTLWPNEATLICADRAQIGQVVANLVLNARDAMPNGGHLSVEVAQRSDDQQALLVVRDDGAGMDAATAALVFEPFFTTKGMDGTGLGLSTAHGIVIQSGGQITLDSAPGQGTTFTVKLPLANADSQPAEADATGPTAGGAETILLVEDDTVVRTVIARMLRQHGYRLITAESGEEAIALARAADGEIDLLITDIVMRGLNGRETAEAILTQQPQTKVLYMSGYADDTVIRVGHFEPGISFIQKPFGGDELDRCIRELLDAASGVPDEAAEA